MIYAFHGTANQVYPQLVNTILAEGSRVGVRGTSTLELEPAILEIVEPRKRLVSSYGRPLNVAFALAEVLWILRGRRDVEMLSWYNSTMRKWSDDGLTFNAAYGFRVRKAHGYDQIEDLILTLGDDKHSRRGVLTIWHPRDRGWTVEPAMGSVQVKRNTLDRACNIMAQAWIRDEKLNWVQVVRSNDAILGIPYNIFQWTSIQEYVANRLGVGLGLFRYYSNIPHIYLDTYYKDMPDVRPFDIYRGANEPPSMATDNDTLKLLDKVEEELRHTGVTSCAPEVFANTMWHDAFLLWEAHHQYRLKRDLLTLDILLGAGVLGMAQLKFYWVHRWSKLEPDKRSRIAGEIVNASGFTPGADEEIHWLLEDV